MADIIIRNAKSLIPRKAESAFHQVAATRVGKRVLANSSFVEENYCTSAEMVMDMINSGDAKYITAGALINELGFRGVGRTLSARAKKDNRPVNRDLASLRYEANWLLNELCMIAKERASV